MKCALAREFLGFISSFHVQVPGQEKAKRKTTRKAWLSFWLPLLVLAYKACGFVGSPPCFAKMPQRHQRLPRSSPWAGEGKKKNHAQGVAFLLAPPTGLEPVTP